MMRDTSRMSDAARYFENRQEEIDSAVQYRAMAEAESRPTIADVYRKLASIEEKHIAFWEKRLSDAKVPFGPREPSLRARVLVRLAKWFGAQLILPTVASQEYTSRNAYLAHPETHGTQMTEEERMHARVLESLLAKSRGVQGAVLGRLEGRHRSVGGNALRAAVLGANDGLCSNLSLVMGVAGAAVDHRTIVLTGLAGLLAGACSMALGEWVSVTSSRELAEREIRIEKRELEETPEEEREELQLIYESKGLSKEEARELSEKLMEKQETALDALTREELGIDPQELGGSAWVAAVTSLLLFAAGAIIPVAPLFFLRGNAGTLASVSVSGIGLFAIGAAISIFTGRSPFVSGGRQLALGFIAAAATFAIGKAIGVAVAG